MGGFAHPFGPSRLVWRGRTDMSKVWFITGTSRGFGREWAQAALERGDRVAGTARDLGTLEPLVKQYPEAFLALALDEIGEHTSELRHDVISRMPSSA